MIPVVNLLPYRNAMRARKRQAFYTQVAFAALVGGVVSMGIYGAYARLISVQEQRNTLLSQETARLDHKVAEVKKLSQTIHELESRRKAVEDLQVARNTSVEIVQSAADRTPDQVRLTDISEQASQVTLTGVTSSQQRVADFLRNLSEPTSYLSKPQLISIEAQNAARPAGESGPPVLVFKISAHVGPVKADKKPGASEKAGNKEGDQS